MQINNLNIVPDWRLANLDGQRLHVLFLPLLSEIERINKLTKAAERCGLSYRHAWNILRDAEQFFGHPVTLMERGRGAQLTELGRVLLQANQRIEARLHTQMESLAMELNSEVHRVLSDQVRVLSIYASHGYAVALIPQHLQGFQTELHYHGPMDALRALKAGECRVAGFTMPLHHRIESLQPQYRDLLDMNIIRIRQFIKRQQGLIVSAEFADSMSSLNDLKNSDARFINRQPLSDTRDLLDQLIEEAGIAPSDIKGYDNHEYTHSAVAAHVATGMADVAFGVKAAAARFDLEFVPITEDRYYWAYRSEAEYDADIVAFISMLNEQGFQNEVNRLPGYQCDNSGETISVSDLL